MQITEVRVFPVDEEKLKAYASIILDQCFIINDLKVIQGRRGLFISMPSRRRKRGGYRDVAHPLNNETRQMIEERVLAEYQVALESGAPAVDFDGADSGGPIDHDSSSRWSPAAPLAAAAASVAQAPAPAEPQAPPPAGEDGEKSLEEVEELHLRDSFWSVS